jgi:hypothetical protein
MKEDLMKIQEQRKGRLYLSRITYSCDMTRDDPEATIALGTIAEIVFANGRGLVLSARAELSGDELARIAWRMRSELTKPFESLFKDFQWAWNQPPGVALEQLATKYSDALFFSPPHVSTECEEFDMTKLVQRTKSALLEMLRTTETTLPSSLPSFPLVSFPPVTETRQQGELVHA